jgi:hypothetical protein
MGWNTRWNVAQVSNSTQRYKTARTHRWPTATHMLRPPRTPTIPRRLDQRLDQNPTVPIPMTWFISLIMVIVPSTGSVSRGTVICTVALMVCGGIKKSTNATILGPTATILGPLWQKLLRLNGLPFHPPLLETIHDAAKVVLPTGRTLKTATNMSSVSTVSLMRSLVLQICIFPTE